MRIARSVSSSSATRASNFVKFVCFFRRLFRFFIARSYVVFKSRPKTTRFWSEKSPTSRRKGNGIVLIKVGAAMIWPSAAKRGLLIDIDDFQIKLALQDISRTAGEDSRWTSKTSASAPLYITAECIE